MNKRLLAVLLAVVLVVSLVGCNSSTGSTDESVGLTDGTYTHEVEGYGGSFEVTTVIKEGQIAEVTVGENNETVDIAATAIESIPQAIVDNQSVGVEAISGATVTSTAIIEGVKAAITEAGGNPDDYMTEVTASYEDEELYTDVLVIGGGGAGLSAAIEAANNGAEVVLIEAAPMLGGNTIRAGGPYNAVDPKRQAANEPASEGAMESIKELTTVESKSDRHQYWMDQLAEDIAEYEEGSRDYLFDSVALHILQTYDGGDYAGDLEFIEELASEALPTAEWMEENGVQWKDDISTVPGGLWPRAHVPINAAGGDYIRAGETKALDLGVDIVMNARATTLLNEGGRIVGAVAERPDGAVLTINAEKGVVLATGGFAANKEMRQKYDETLLPELVTTNAPTILGDGITMAEEVGANLVGMEYIQSLPLGDPETGGLNRWLGAIGVEYYYQVNQDGVRFMAEDGRRDEMTQALLEQEGALSYVITGDNRETESETNLWGDNIEELIQDGIIFKADTIEELAEQIGIDPEVLAATHEEFNEYVKAGEDPDFGRGLFGDTIEAPYYASVRIPTVHHTMGGVQIDLEGRVLDLEGTPIPGLYAAGEVTGGIHGTNRLGGNALVDIHVFGRIAGKTVATDS